MKYKKRMLDLEIVTFSFSKVPQIHHELDLVRAFPNKKEIKKRGNPTLRYSVNKHSPGICAPKFSLDQTSNTNLTRL
jgi:hypothetical protein